MENVKSRIEFHRDDHKISGHLWGRKEEPQHAVILCHGFLANEKMCHKYAALLEQQGFMAVTFDFCGGGIGVKSEGRSQDMTVFTEMADLMAVVKGVRSRYAPLSISLLGCSQGGLVSAMVAREPGNEIYKLILLYPALCIPDDARKGKMMFYKFDPENIPEVLGRFPMKLGGEYARSVKELDPLEMIRGYDGPVLYLQGSEDNVVDVSYARRAKEVYHNCQYHEIAGGGHMFRGEHDLEACRLISAFMSE